MSALAAAALLAPPASAGAGSTGAASLTSLRVSTCQTGAGARQRYAVFHGQMRAVPGTSRMWMRFTLIDRSSDRSAPVPVTQLARWRKSRQGVNAFGYAQKITGLKPGGTYAAAVEFRWVDARGHTIRSARRTSSDCRQDGHLPNLSVTRIAAQPGAAQGTELYLVDVANTGAASARDVRLDLVVDGATADSVYVDLIEPGETVTKKISGPQCSLRVRAVVDRLDAIPETTEDDNTLRSRCPAVGG